MTLPKIQLKPLRPERYGHPWIFAGEIASGPDPDTQSGDWVQIIDHNSKFAGAGYYNPKSKIIVRRLPLPGCDTAEPTPPNQAWWTEQIRKAFQYRKARGSTDRGLYRLIHAEADHLPGLIVDVYGDFVAVQLLTLGMALRRDQIVVALNKLLQPKGIYERSDTSVRKLEGLEEFSGVISGEAPPERMEINDESAKILINIAHGGKTGLFLDQLDNQKAAAYEATGRDVLNVFSYTGLFGLRAAIAGAKSVEDVESSAFFQEIAQTQWNLNKGLFSKTKYTQTTGNAFDILREREEANFKTDMVILDPPAFTKNRSNAASALRGYNEINRRAFKMLRPNGVLVTCSCSHHLDISEFEEVVMKSARDAKREIRLIERRSQPPDHPVLLSVPETEYLKMLILAVD